MPEISVIVPVYKAEAYINRCVDSILAQTFTNFELILVDDGSPDGSGAICDEYAQKDSRVHVIHKPNGGVSSARNAGLDAAKGNWITFVDSDDYVTASYLEDLYEPGYDLTVVSHLHINSRDGSTKESLVKSFATQNLDGVSFQRILAENGTYWIMFCWGRLFRRSLLLQNQIRYKEGLNCGEDYLFSAGYLSVCSSLCLKEAASYIHIAEDSGTLSTTFDIAFFSNLEKAENAAASVLEKRFGIAYPRKSDEELRLIYAGCINAIAADQQFTFPQKYAIFKYLYRIPLFRDTLSQPDRYYGEASELYRLCIRIRSPLLMLLALTIMLKIKK